MSKHLLYKSNILRKDSLIIHFVFMFGVLFFGASGLGLVRFIMYLFIFGFRATTGDTHGFFLALHSEVTPDSD